MRIGDFAFPLGHARARGSEPASALDARRARPAASCIAGQNAPRMGAGQRRRAMTRIRFEFDALTLDAELFATPTAQAIAAALPISSSALTWGEEVYFEVPVKAAREKDARAVVVPGEIAYWPDGPGRTPISRGDETRLASPCNIFGRAIGDVKVLAKV